MATIKDYLRWRGDLGFEERPFNAVDNVVLATLAYVDLRGIARESGGLTLAEALGLVLSGGDDVAPYIRSMAAVDAELLDLVARSARFGGALVCDYVDEIDEASALQFSATTFDLPSGPVAVAFRGTDHSLVGWRENFMMSFEVTLAQRRAAAYLERAVAQAVRARRRVVACGHSKGGNLAAYAAAVCPPDLQAQVDQVWDDDGPDMASEVVSTALIDALGARLVRVVPEYSIVGMLFARPDERHVVVRSSASGFLQHDPTSWEVDVDDLARAERLSAESRLVAEAFSSWLADVDLKARETFTNELFDALAAGDPDRIDAVFTSPAAVQRVLAASGDLGSETRLVIRKLLGALTTTATGAAASAVDRAVGSATAAVRGLAGTRQTRQPAR